MELTSVSDRRFRVAASAPACPPGEPRYQSGGTVKNPGNIRFDGWPKSALAVSKKITSTRWLGMVASTQHRKNGRVKNAGVRSHDSLSSPAIAD
jgi:hypothetical protein